MYRIVHSPVEAIQWFIKKYPVCVDLKIQYKFGRKKRAGSQDYPLNALSLLPSLDHQSNKNV